MVVSLNLRIVGTDHVLRIEEADHAVDWNPSMQSSRSHVFVLAALVLSLLVLNVPDAVPQERQAGVGPVTTAAQLPAAILAQLPATAAEAGLDYAPRLVQVEVPTREDRNRLASSGLDVTEHAGDDFIEVVLTEPAHEQVIADLGLTFTMVTPDLITQERDRILADAAYFRANASSPLPSEPHHLPGPGRLRHRDRRSWSPTTPTWPSASPSASPSRAVT